MELACSPTIRHCAHESRNDGNRGHRNHFRLGGADVLRDLMFIKDDIDIGRQSGDRPMGTKNVVIEGMTLDSTLTPFTDDAVMFWINPKLERLEGWRLNQFLC